MGWVVNATLWPLYPRERDPVPIVQEAGWVPGTVWTAAENLVATGIRSQDRPAHSQLQYQLSYRGPHIHRACQLHRHTSTVVQALCLDPWSGRHCSETSNTLAVGVVLLLCIWNVQGSKLGRDLHF